MNEQSNSRAILSMGMLAFTLVKALLKLSLVVAASTLIMTYVLGMGEWTFNGFLIKAISSTSLRVSVFICIAYCVIFRPISIINMKVESKSNILSQIMSIEQRRAERYNIDDTEVNEQLKLASEALDKHYVPEFNNAMSWSIAIYIITGLVSSLIRNPMINKVGNPATDILLLAIMTNIPRIFSNVKMMRVFDSMNSLDSEHIL